MPNCRLSLNAGRFSLTERRSGRRAGFTLVELITVMGIAAIILALVAPSVTSMLTSYNISSTAEKVTSTLSLAR